MESMVVGVRVWWIALCAVSVVNVAAWSWSTLRLMRREQQLPGIVRARWPHLFLSAGYVLGCGFRSILPRADVQRIVLYDSFLSSVMVGRTVATIAELCFVAQWALLLRELAQDEDDSWGVAISRVILPLIVVAETCSWYAVLTTSYIGNAMEQSLWTFTASLMAISLYLLWRRGRAHLRWFLLAAMVACAGFVVFMCTVDVPMYLTRWLADEQVGRPYLSLLDGVVDVSSRWHVTERWQDWHEEIPWMSLYFSVAVWISIALVHAPRREMAMARERRRRG
jgi:hypothetical protein